MVDTSTNTTDVFTVDSKIKSTVKYDLEKFMRVVFDENDWGMQDPFTSLFMSQIPKLPPKSTTTVGSENEYHPEYISYDTYGSVNYWPLIMIYNGIVTMDELVPTREIKLFSLNDLENLFLRLNGIKSSSVNFSVHARVDI